MSNTQQASPTNQAAKTKNTKKLAIAAILLIIVVALATVAAYQLLSQPQLDTTQPPQTSPQISPKTSPQNTPQNPSSLSWMTKGAYATYEGQTSILSFSISFTAKMEVVDLNATHVQVLTDLNASTPFGSYSNQTTMWVNKADCTFQPEGLNYTRSYDAQVTVAGLGTRNCIAYEYVSDSMNATYYMDKTIQWPIKMTLTTTAFEDQTYSIDINLTDTNIQGIQ